MERKDMPGVWRLRVYIGRDGNGRPKQVSKQFKGTKRDAETELSRFVTNTQQRYNLGRDDVKTVEDLLRRWLDHIEPDRSLSYMREARRRVDRRLVPAFGRYRIERFETTDIDRVYKLWTEEGLSASSVRGLHATMSAAFRQGEKWKAVVKAANPVSDATVPAVHATKTSAMSAPEIAMVLAEADDKNPVLAFAIRFAILLGVRRGELCALRWSDVDWSKKTVRVARALTVIRGDITEGDTKTHQDRDLALGDGLEVLKTWREAQEILAALGEKSLAPDSFILSRRGDGRTPVMPDSLTQAFSRLTERLGMDYHFHDLRHAMATTAVAAKMDPVTVAGRLGHADPSLTLRVYSHAMGAQDREVADLMASTMGVLHNAENPGSFT